MCVLVKLQKNICLKAPGFASKRIKQIDSKEEKYEIKVAARFILRERERETGPALSATGPVSLSLTNKSDSYFNIVFYKSNKAK